MEEDRSPGAELVQVIEHLVADRRAWAQLVRDLGSAVAGNIVVVVVVNQKTDVV